MSPLSHLLALPADVSVTGREALMGVTSGRAGGAFLRCSKKTSSSVDVTMLSAFLCSGSIQGVSITAPPL